MLAFLRDYNNFINLLKVYQHTDDIKISNPKTRDVFLLIQVYFWVRSVLGFSSCRICTFFVKFISKCFIYFVVITTFKSLIALPFSLKSEPIHKLWG